ncbi:MAG: LamB/YcsF family protein [Thermoanaerobaculia bacterium]|nr:LamB/YcsF family protein [Thermoanaerobaculia bacterium]
MNIDLSCDMGESSDAGSLAVEEAIWPLITSANIACGGHAGNDASMRHAVRLAIAHDVAIGAHPSYPDREHFGRRSMDIGREALGAALREQIGALARIAAEEGAAVEHVKPHGALYNDAHRDLAAAQAIVEVCREAGAAIVAAAGSAVEREARGRGCRVILEGFADRRYRGDGSLQPRGEEGSLLLDISAAAAQAVKLAQSAPITAADATTVNVPCETICIHSDMPGAVARLQCIRAALIDAGFVVAPLDRGE